ncbi:MAG: hypothetical protein ACLQU3_30975 [Limisphaerales bacterium]
MNLLRRLLLVAPLFIGPAPAPLRGQSFQVEGELTWAKWDGLPLARYGYDVYVNGGEWSMSVRKDFVAQMGGDEEYGFDGENFYHLSFGNQTPLSPVALAATNKAVHRASTVFLSGQVSRDEVNIPFSYSGWPQFLWFAFASRSYLRTNASESLPCRFCVEKPPPCMLPARFLRDVLHTNCVVGYTLINPGKIYLSDGTDMPEPTPFDKGFVFQEFRATSLTNRGDLTVPMAFTVTTYTPKPDGRSTNDLAVAYVVNATVQRVTWNAALRDPKPAIPAEAYIVDYRLQQMSQNPHAFYIATNWLQPANALFKERVQIELRHKGDNNATRSMRKSGVILILLILVSVPPVVVLLKQRKAGKCQPC